MHYLNNSSEIPWMVFFQVQIIEIPFYFSIPCRFDLLKRRQSYSEFEDLIEKKVSAVCLCI